VNKQFEIYRRFTDKEDASLFIDALKENEIDFVIDNVENKNDVIFAPAQALEGIYIKIKPSDFEKANSIGQENNNTLNQDRIIFLKEFEDDDLIQIIQNPNEWDTGDIEIAKLILKERGNINSESDVNEIRKTKIEALIKGKNGETLWITIGFIFALLGGLWGFVLGWYYNTDKTTAPNGERYFTYNPITRKKGLYIFYISIVAAIIESFLWFKFYHVN
jgi:hypothetical protein